MTQNIQYRFFTPPLLVCEFVSAVCFTGELITLNELEDAQLYPLILTIILVRLLKKLENISHILNFKQNKN